MKKTGFYFVSIIFAVIALSFSGCKEHEPPTIFIANGASTIIIDQSDLESLAIPVVVTSEDALSAIDAYITTDIDVFPVRRDAPTDDKRFTKTYTYSDMANILTLLTSQGVEPKCFGIHASNWEFKEATVEVPFELINDFILPGITIAPSNERIPYDMNNLQALKIPVNISSEVALHSVEISIQASNEEIFEIPKQGFLDNEFYNYSHTYTLTDLAGIMNQIKSRDLEPETFTVKAGTVQGTHRTVSKEFQKL